ncbi:MAG: DUF6055 domain-containing protein [Prevotella sp.]
MFVRLVFVLLALGSLSASAQKRIYTPKDLQQMDLLCDSSQWSYARMTCTDNFAIMWQKGFGYDLSCPPDLEGNPMKVDMDNLKDKLESYYAFFRDSLQFTRKGSKADKYRMMVMLNYSLEGTAYGGDYDGEIGALWLAPNRVQDKRLNCIAHELGHSFQSQITCDGEGEAWGGCGFFEMTSQWMLWQVNPEWITDEKYHFDAFTKTGHKAFLHLENIYHSPYVIECWGEKHGKPFIAELFRQGKRGEDPVMTYMRLTGMTQAQFCDEMFCNVRRMVNMDFPRAWKETRPYAEKFSTKLRTMGAGWQRVEPECCPENYGFNVIRLDVPKTGATAKVQFRGIAKAEGYVSLNPEAAGWRYGLVGIDTDGNAVYGKMYSAKNGTATLKTSKERPLKSLYLVVMGAPTRHWRNVDAWGPEGEQEPQPDAQWAYEVKIKN